jgi:hypothetical protein
MPFDIALDSTQKGYLRDDHYEARVYLSVNSNTVVYSARLNNADWLVPTATLPVDGGSGTPSDMEIDMTILISHDNNPMNAYWTGRLRESDGVGYVLSAGAGVIYCNETGDLGFADDDYLWVIRDFAVAVKLPRAGNEIPISDWNQPFSELRPLISGIQSVYADWVDDVSGVYEIDIPPVCQAAASGASIDAGSYLHTFPAGITIVSGSTTSLNVTIQADPCATEYHCKFEVSDNNGNTSVFRYIVFAHDESNPPILVSFSDLQITQSIPIDVLQGAAEGYNATVRAFEGVDDILNNTLVCPWVDQRFGTTQADIGSSGNILLVGRLRSEDNATGYADGQRTSSVEFQIEGVISQLVRQHFDSFYIRDATSPAQWGEVKNLTVWRAIVLVFQAYSTFLELHSLRFDDTTDDFRMPSLTTQGGDLLNTVADLAQSISAVLQDNPAGMCEVVRRLPMLPVADRGSVVVVLDVITGDFGGPDALNLTIDHVKLIGQVKGDGGGYNTTTGRVSGYRVRAPNGVRLGTAKDGQIPRQVLIANQTTEDEKAELEERAGNALAAQWGAVILILHTPDGYQFLTPDAQARITLTIPASETVRGRAFDDSIYWWLQAKTLSVNPQTGRIETHHTAIQETSGTPGKVDPPAQIQVTPFNSVNAPQNPPPEVEDTDDSGDLAGANIDVGSACPPNICSDCSGGQNYIDTWIDTGADQTFQTITITYDADASQSGFNSYVQIRSEGQFFYTVGSAFNVQAGTGLTEIVIVGGLTGRDIRVVLVGDEGGCGDTVTLTDISWSSTAPILLDSFSVPATDSNGVDSAVTLVSGQLYRIRLKGTISQGGSSSYDALWELVNGVYAGPLIWINGDTGQTNFSLGNAAFNPAHIYDFYFRGLGATVNVGVGDSVFGDNSGAFTAEIYKV